MIVQVSLRPVEAIKLHRTDTTLDLSQKAEKGMRVGCTGHIQCALIGWIKKPQVWAATSAHTKLSMPVICIRRQTEPLMGRPAEFH